MTNKPNTRPWDNIRTEEDDEYDHALAYLLARYPGVEHDMATYAKIMERGAALALAIASALQWLCTAVIMTHIRTPRWVRRVLFYGSAVVVGAGAGLAIVALFVWLLTR